MAQPLYGMTHGPPFVLFACVCCVCCVCCLVCCLLVVCLLSPSPRVPCCWSCIAAMARCGRLVRPRVHPLHVLCTCLVQAGFVVVLCLCLCVRVRVCLCVCVCVLPQYPRMCGRVLSGRCCALWCADGACRASSFPYGTRVHCPVHVRRVFVFALSVYLQFRRRTVGECRSYCRCFVGEDIVSARVQLSCVSIRF